MVGGFVMVWYTYRIQGLLNHIIDKNVAAFQAAEALEIALVNQKGFVSYNFLDGDPDWLRQRGEYRQIFRERLNDARSFAENKREKEAIDLIDSEYNQYITLKDQVIAYYKRGEREAGATLHQKMRNRFFKILDLCEEYKNIHTEGIARVRYNSHAEAKNLRIIAGTAVFAALSLAVLLAFVLIVHVLTPVRRLALEADREGDSRQSGDEVKALGRSVRGLIEDVDHTYFELEKSRETLLQAEKMAMVGKLAAGMAHSIRNPLTSVKMRMFSLAGLSICLLPRKRTLR
jgi:C4-dicarboxylate-specific signal transduction histidine kinase